MAPHARPQTGLLTRLRVVCAQTAGNDATQKSTDNSATSIGLGLATPTGAAAVPTLVPAVGRRRRRHKH